ncbi:hypothetical protein Tco_0990716 [Tanacetum coccineum]|uniref:Uncharacterized protein n=1 Tax=Tanacetum coccineum TaxID=301880 RepID=A0ABQ5EYW7_9ASTR
MAESSSQNPSSPEITPKEEPVTFDKPESPNPFLPASQVDLTFDEITFTTNNEVALLYPSHPNQEYFKDVSDFISKCCLSEAFTRAPTQYKEYLSEFWYTTKTLEGSKHNTYLTQVCMFPLPSITTVRPWFSTIGYKREIGAKGTLKKSCLPPRWRLLMAQIMQCLGDKIGGLGQISNKDATILYCLANGVQVDYAKILWEDLIHKLNKKTRKKIVPYPRFISLLLEHMMPEYDNEELTINLTQVFSVHNWTLKPNQPEEPPFTTHMKAIFNLDVPVDSKALKPSSQTEKVPQGKNPRAKSGLRRKQSSKHTFESKTEASKSKTGQSEKETKSSSAKDKSPIHPSPTIPVVGEMHKEAQQAVGGPTSLGATTSFIFTLSLHQDMTFQQIPQLKLILEYLLPTILILSKTYKTKSAGDGLKTAHTDSGANEESRADDISLKVKLEDLSDILKDTRSAFFTPDSPPDEPIIVSDESEEEEEVAKG